MYRFSGFRGILAVGFAVVLAAMAVLPAAAKNQPSGSVAALPEPLTRESVRELVSRLSDDEVRKLLLDQLDRAAAAPATRSRGAIGMSGMVDEHAGMMRTNFAALQGALVDLPKTMRQVETKLTEPDGPSQLLIIAEILAALLAIGWVVESIYDRALHDYRARLASSPVDSFSANAFRLGVGLLLDIGGIVVWSLAALTAFFLMWHDHALRRTTILDFMIVVVIVRIAWLVARFLLAKDAGPGRLLPFADAPAATLRRFAVVLAAIFGITIAAVSLFRGGGASEATLDLIMIVAVTTGMLVTIWTVWRVRVPIANLIRGDGRHGAIVGWLADLWPVIATLYFLGILVGPHLGRPRRGDGGQGHGHHQRAPRRRAADRRHDAVPCARRGGQRFDWQGGARARVPRVLRGGVSPRDPHRRHRGRIAALRTRVGHQRLRDRAAEHGRQDLELAPRHLASCCCSPT